MLSHAWLRGGSSEVELVSAGGAIDLADLGSASALRAGSKDAAAQDEIDDKSDQVGNQHHQQSPESGGHAPAAGLALKQADGKNGFGKKEICTRHFHPPRSHALPPLPRVFIPS